MIRTIEAAIDELGAVRLLHPVRIAAALRTLVTILEEQPLFNPEKEAPDEDWAMPRDDVQLLLHETAAWDAASDEDALKIEGLLLEMS